MSQTATYTPPTGGVVPHVNVDGASDASAFYQRTFAGRELFRNVAEDGKRLMVCHMQINGGSFLISDCFPEWGVTKQPSPTVTMHLQVDDVDAWWQRAVDAGATVLNPLEDAFWGERYGRLQDPFGVNWSMASPIKR